MTQRSAFFSVKDILTATQGMWTIYLHILFQKAGQWTFTFRILMWKIVNLAGKWLGSYYRGVSFIFQWQVHCISHLAYFKRLRNEVLPFFILENWSLCCPESFSNLRFIPAAYNNILILSSQKCVVTSNVIRCMTYDRATSRRCRRVTTRWPVYWRFYSVENVLRFALSTWKNGTWRRKVRTTKVTLESRFENKETVCNW